MFDELDDSLDKDGHNPTVYLSTAEMKAVEKGLPFSDPWPDNGCWNCLHFNGNACTKEWNNMDESYYRPDRDDRDLHDWCEDFSMDVLVGPED